MGLRRLMGLMVVIFALMGFGLAAAAPECLGSSAHAANCDWDGDGIANKDDPDDDNDGCLDEADNDKWVADPDNCSGGGEPEPEPDPIDELIAALCGVVPDLPVCGDGGGGEPPTPDEIVAAFCEQVPDAPICDGGGEPPPAPTPEEIVAAVCEQAPDAPVCTL